MVKKVIAIGDSFLAGSELQNTRNVWPGLFADTHHLEYECQAKPGHTSQFVLRTLFEKLLTETDSCLFVIHWPSALRFEYVDRDNDSWVQINPNAILNGNIYSTEVQKIYYQHMNSLLGDKWNNLLMIYSAIQALKNTSHCCAMTAVDDFLFSTDFHTPPYVEFLQTECKSQIHLFDGLTFLQWSDHNKFPKGRYGHPLEQAHQRAFEYLNPTYKKLIDIHTSNK